MIYDIPDIEKFIQEIHDAAFSCKDRVAYYPDLIETAVRKYVLPPEDVTCHTTR